ncbi:glycosyltransferase family 1 protein [Robiginitalea sp. M366]|uniref:glycosyltransferase family 4 protein n=1 Tax=Robiginitalea aestuariiviva TaxID=3036903 RepID=UPI00240E69D7|nr:glycosyltransferase family 1 protein [Robiginitalea aestuariiviva]MDG1571471.1 glycosyltransferase family 1 protein [Robiginitalea aestuariiviva]
MNLNILVDAHVFDGKHQGTRTYLKGLYIALFRLCPNWTFFMVAKNTENLEIEFGKHPHVHYLKLTSKNKFKRLLIEFPSIIKKNNIDYAHFQYISPLLKNCKHIVTTHDILFEQKEFRKYFPLKYRLVNGLLFRLSAKRADILLTVSNYSKSKISELYRIPLENIHLTFNGVEKDFYQLNRNYQTEEYIKGKKYILYVSRIEPRKNHITVLRAFFESRIYEKEIKLVFIGSRDINDPLLSDYLNQYQSELQHHVYWLQNVHFQEIKHYYANCSLFVFPSYAEGFGIPVLEAMVFGKRILISNKTAMKDFNLPSELTFDPYDVEELKNKMYNSLFINNNYNFLSLYKEILAKYSWENSAKQLVRVINDYSQ